MDRNAHGRDRGLMMGAAAVHQSYRQGDARASSDVPSVVRRPSGRRIRLVLADDQPITLAGLDALFSRESEFLVLQRCTNGREAVRAVIAHRPDVVLLNQNLPPTDAVAVLRTLRAEGTTVRAVLLGDRPNGHHFEWALRLGVYGVAFKTMDPRLLIDCVRDVFAGKRRLDRDESSGEGRAVPASRANPAHSRGDSSRWRGQRPAGSATRSSRRSWACARGPSRITFTRSTSGSSWTGDWPFCSISRKRPWRSP